MTTTYFGTLALIRSVYSKTPTAELGLMMGPKYRAAAGTYIAACVARNTAAARESATVLAAYIGYCKERGLPGLPRIMVRSGL